MGLIDIEQIHGLRDCEWVQLARVHIINERSRGELILVTRNNPEHFDTQPKSQSHSWNFFNLQRFQIILFFVIIE